MTQVPAPKNPEFLQYPINELVDLKDKSIDELDFATAEDIQTAIDYIQSTHVDNHLNDVCIELEKELKIIFEEKTKKIESINSTFNQKERDLRERIDSQLHEIQHRHLNQLVDLEKEYTLASIQENKRLIPKYGGNDTPQKQTEQLNN